MSGITGTGEGVISEDDEEIAHNDKLSTGEDEGRGSEEENKEGSEDYVVLDEGIVVSPYNASPKGGIGFSFWG